MKDRINVAFVLLMMAVIVAGCAGQKPMTDKQQGVMWMGVFITEYDSVKTVLESPFSTPAQRELALKKKAVLIKAYPLIKDFTSPVSPINPATGKKWTNIELLKYDGPIVGYGMSVAKINMLMGLIDELVALSGGI